MKWWHITLPLFVFIVFYITFRPKKEAFRFRRNAARDRINRMVEGVERTNRENEEINNRTQKKKIPYHKLKEKELKTLADLLNEAKQLAEEAIKNNPPLDH